MLVRLTVRLLPGNKSQIDRHALGVQIRLQWHNEEVLGAADVEHVLHEKQSLSCGKWWESLVQVLLWYKGHSLVGVHNVPEINGNEGSVEIVFVGSLFGLERAYDWRNMMQIDREYNEPGPGDLGGLHALEERVKNSQKKGFLSRRFDSIRVETPACRFFGCDGYYNGNEHPNTLRR